MLGLLGGDLMVASRVRTAAAGLGHSTRQVKTGSDLAGTDLLLVDLNRDVDRQLTLLAELLAPGIGPKVIAFGPHLLIGEIRERARKAGASRVVANSALPGVLRRSLRRPTEPPTAPGRSSL
ncbi:MAG TPA: hypothetical protein VNF75_04875 [Candidatus Dormibacteraeota bacterium]|nr:hypothetical protein [Candidatus Dormibacteraeota bacterium]